MTPFRFFWGKILPISYDNYLSETEILEALREKVVETIEALNDIKDFIETGLPDEIKKEVTEQIKPLESELSSLRKYVDGEISEVYDKIDATTSNINGKINDLDRELREALEEVNTELTVRIQLLEKQVEQFVADFTNQIAAVRMEISNLDLSTIARINKMYNLVIRWCRKYFNALSGTNIYVTDPTTGRTVLLDTALDNMLQFYLQGLTCIQFYSIGLTCEEFYDLGLTAFEFYKYGLYLIDEPSRNYAFFDNRGVRSTEPISATYSSFGRGITADMNASEVTCEEFYDLDRTSEDWSKIGLFILTGISSVTSSYFITTISGTLTCDDATGSHNLLFDVAPDTHYVGYTIPEQCIVSHDASYDMPVLPSGYDPDEYRIQLNPDSFDVVHGEIDRSTGEMDVMYKNNLTYEVVNSTDEVMETHVLPVNLTYNLTFSL